MPERELVPATGGGGGGDSRSIEVDPASRRVANIRTVAVKQVPMGRTIRAIDELTYEEGSLRTIAAWSEVVWIASTPITRTSLWRKETAAR